MSLFAIHLNKQNTLNFPSIQDGNRECKENLEIDNIYYTCGELED